MESEKAWPLGYTMSIKYAVSDGSFENAFLRSLEKNVQLTGNTRTEPD